MPADRQKLAPKNAGKFFRFPFGIKELEKVTAPSLAWKNPDFRQTADLSRKNRRFFIRFFLLSTTYIC